MRVEGFGYKNAWIAVKGATPEAVARALGLRNLRPCQWEAGIAAAYESSVFVAPPIDGWILCVGRPMTDLADSRAPVFGRRVEEWSAELQAEVQYFATHRVVSASAWARARPTGLERAYMYIGESGEKVIDHGAATAEERALGFAFFDPDSPEAARDDYWERPDLTFPDEEHVMLLAGRWSVDPSSLGERDIDVGDGLLADFGEALVRSLSPPPPAATAPVNSKPWWKLW